MLELVQNSIQTTHIYGQSEMQETNLLIVKNWSTATGQESVVLLCMGKNLLFDFSTIYRVLKQVKDNEAQVLIGSHGQERGLDNSAVILFFFNPFQSLSQYFLIMKLWRRMEAFQNQEIKSSSPTYSLFSQYCK